MATAPPNTSEAHAPTPDLPTDNPLASRPPALDHLEVLTGHWKMKATFEAGYFSPGSPAMTDQGGRTSFAWLEGGLFLIQQFSNPHAAAPDGIAIIGGTRPDSLTQHYYDSRGVHRIYNMSLTGRAWTLWREKPGFWQRYTGTISDDGRTIIGAWEGSADGARWQHDFSLAYIKLDPEQIPDHTTP